MLMILLTYIIYGYPKGVQINRIVNSLVKRIIKEGALTLIIEENMYSIYEYKQLEEKSNLELKDK